MKQTAIIYCRKSTDREEMQQNSLEHQLNNCRNTASLLDLEVIDEISESKSAKDEFTRAGFNRMIDKCIK
jgi:DNA invertase Pin-like site-specific DNA recombinase